MVGVVPGAAVEGAIGMQVLLVLLVVALLAVPAGAEPERPAEFAWFAEGETCRDHAWISSVTANADYAGCYAGGMLVCARADAAPDGAWQARFTAEVPADGTYVLWLAATPPGVGSPLSVRIDDAKPVAVSGVREGAWGPGTCFSWLPAARVGLTKGTHTVVVGVTGRRQADNKYYAYLDALALERVSDDAAVPFTAYPVLADIRKPEVRIYSGNLSVGWFQQYWGTDGQGTGAIDPAMIALLRRCACTAMCDYQAWCRVEQKPGEWDWSFYQANARALHAAGIQYNVFAWLHFPPKWFTETPDYVPYRCLEHGEALQQLSLWAPYTLKLYADYYRRLSRDFGEDVDFLRLAMPSEYGELGYATGMTNWLVPQRHVHSGFWCGDAHALADFRTRMRARFGAVDALNRRWGTAYAGWEEVAPPEVAGGAAARKALETRSPQARRRWLDFIDWYQDAWGDFAVRASAIAKECFPRKEVILSLGYGAENPCFGNDQSRHVKRFAEAGVAAQTPGDIGGFATKRVSTACRAYGVPYYTEPPGSVDRRRQARRLFFDISNGTQTFFDYPQNLDGARDVVDACAPHLTGQPARCDVAFLMPSAWWWCHPEWGWPVRTLRFAEGVRDRLDYEVVDELLVRDGALQKLGIRVLALVEGDFLHAETLAALQQWVRGGGVLALLGVAHLEDIDGQDGVFQAMAPTGAAPGVTLPEAWQGSARKVGEGLVISVPGGDDRLAVQQDAMAALTYRLGDIAPGRKSAPCLSDGKDGVLTTLFADRALFYNTTARPVRKALALRPGDALPGRRRIPAGVKDLLVPAHGVAAVFFEE